MKDERMEGLKRANEKLIVDRSRLSRENDRLKARIAALEKRIAEHIKANDLLRAELKREQQARLKAEQELNNWRAIAQRGAA